MVLIYQATVNHVFPVPPLSHNMHLSTIVTFSTVVLALAQSDPFPNSPNDAIEGSAITYLNDFSRIRMLAIPAQRPFHKRIYLDTLDGARWYDTTPICPTTRSGSQLHRIMKRW
jgi:hypothetical protein